jgi:hypothetical protein
MTYGRREDGMKMNYTYESVADVPTEELVDVLCEVQKKKWEVELIIGTIMNELVKRKDKKANDKKD